MSSKLSASPRTAHTAITRMSSSRCSTFHSHLGSSTVSNAAIKVSSMASLRRKAEPLAGQAAEMEALISCVTPAGDPGDHGGRDHIAGGDRPRADATWRPDAARRWRLAGGSGGQGTEDTGALRREAVKGRPL